MHHFFFFWFGEDCALKRMATKIGEEIYIQQLLDYKYSVISNALFYEFVHIFCVTTKKKILERTL